MATFAHTLPTLLDQVKRHEPDGAFARIIEKQAQINDVLADAPAVEGNMPNGHLLTMRTGLPTIGYRRYNEGVDPSSSTTEQATEALALMTGLSKVDVELAKFNGDEAAFRASEDEGFVQAMSNKASRDLFYSSTKTDPAAFHGLSPRYDALSLENGPTHIIQPYALSGSDYTSMWAIGWGMDSAHLFYAKGSPAGLSYDDMGKQLSRDANNREFPTWVTNWTWKLGLAIPDWRYIVRIQIDVSAAYADNGAALLVAMIKAYNRIQSLANCNLAFYANRSVRTILDIQATNKANNFLTNGEWYGRKVTMFREAPIRLCEALLETETAVS